MMVIEDYAPSKVKVNPVSTPQPTVCGALGCRNTQNLRQSRDAGGRVRTLCPECDREFQGGSP